MSALSRWPVVLALYALATALLTWPLAAQVRTHVPLSNADLWTNLWNFWWWRTALFELGTSPYATGLLFHPTGASLALHTHSPLNIVATLPVSLLFGVEAAYNSALLLSFFLAAASACALVRYLTGEPRAAFFAGLLYAFTPMHFEQTLDHLNVASVQFLPLAVLLVLRVCREGGPGLVVGLGLCLAANALVAWYHGLISILFGAAVVARELLAAERPPLLVARDLGLSGLIAAALVLPFAWPMLAALAGTPGAAAVPFWNLGVDPLFWLLPSDHHPLLGALTQDTYRALRRPIVDFAPYLGWTALGLALLALARPHFGGPRRLFWGGLAGVLLLLALGQHPVVAGRTFEEIWLPHAFLEQIPILNRLRVANRFQLWAFVPLAVLCGSSLAALFRGRRGWLGWLLGALLVFEFLWLPYPMQEAARHPYMERMAGDPAAGAVLPVPLPFDAPYSEALYDQTRHGRPIVGGYVAYTPESQRQAIEADPFLYGATGRGPLPVAVDVEALRTLGVGTVVVHLDRSRSALRRRWDESETPYERRARHPVWGVNDQTLERCRLLLRRALGAPIFEDDRLEVYRLPP